LDAPCSRYKAAQRILIRDIASMLGRRRGNLDLAHDQSQVLDGTRSTDAAAAAPRRRCTP
jgi:hypothetical protein